MTINFSPDAPLTLTPFPNGGWTITQQISGTPGIPPRSLGAYSSLGDALAALGCDTAEAPTVRLVDCVNGAVDVADTVKCLQRQIAEWRNISGMPRSSLTKEVLESCAHDLEQMIRVIFGVEP